MAGKADKVGRNVELLLIENVDNLGIVGDVVTIKPGYARNYLLPMGLATMPTASAKKAIQEKRAEVERAMREKRVEQERLIGSLEGFEITLKRASNELGQLYGSVTQHDIKEALVEEGFAIKDSDIRIGSQIKRLDSYDIPVQIADDLRTEIKLWVVSDSPIEEMEGDDGEGKIAADADDVADVDEVAEGNEDNKEDE